MAQKLAKTDANQLSYSATVRAAYEVHGKRIAEKAGAVLFKGKKRKRLDLVTVTEDILELLSEAEAELNATAAAHADELADDDPLREERDEIKLEINDDLLRAKSMISGAFGPKFLSRLGLDRPLEDRPDLVQKVAAGVVRLLRKVKKPAQSFAGAKVDFVQIADNGGVKVGRLAGLLSSLKREEREAQQTMVARDQAAAHWRLVVTLAGGWLEGLARIAGENRIADLVRPTERRRAGIQGAAGDVVDGGAEDATDATDTDATDADATDTDADPNG